MNKKLAISGHSTRGKEVIEILEMLGGKNTNNYDGSSGGWFYFDDFGDIDWYHEATPESEIHCFSLEEFLEKYPYKIGDMIRVPEFESEVRINDMKWDGYNIQYEVFTDESEWYTTEELNNWNTKNIEKKEPNPILLQLKKYFEETPKDIIEKEWHEYDKYNEVGPAVDKYLKYVNTIRQPQYPKTYEECCKIIQSDPNFYIDTHLYSDKLGSLYKLLICQKAYWKIAGEQMGLGKPWEPDFKDNSDKYFICYVKDEIWKSNIRDCNRLLVFPTEKIRDEFYENFKDLIKACKNLI